jgi:hypothetical protein
MSKDTIEKISGVVGTILVTVFVLGLAESISSGAAGFWGGLPFWVISLMILALVIYDLWDSCLRKRIDGSGNGNSNNNA